MIIVWNKLKKSKVLTKLIWHAAFTLAEVLITLGVIGVIASLTIPSLIQKQQEMVTVSSLKKAYSTFSQAYIQAVKDNGTPDNWGLIAWSDPQGAENILNTLAPYLKISKKCGRYAGCFPTQTYKYLNGGDDSYDGPFDSNTGYAKAQLVDGSIIAVDSIGATCEDWGSAPMLQQVCGEAYVDINGFKPPNQIGIDLFYFYITKTGITPAGSSLEPVDNFPFDSYCKDKTSANGWGCTAWILYNENMDYLNCNNLSWNGPNKCN